MSGTKRRYDDSTGAQQVFEDIEDVLITVKNLCSGNNFDDNLLSDAIEELLRLIEQFADKRTKGDKAWLPRALDALDREGTNLWNLASAVHPVVKDKKLPLTARLRLSGFRLIEVGFPAKPAIDGLIHLLQLASKTGSMISEAGQPDLASGVLASAAKYEELLRSAEDPGGELNLQRAQATLVYHCTRLEAAWKEGNEAMANYMLQILTANENERFANIPSKDRAMVASKLLEVGKSLLIDQDRQGRSLDSRAAEAVSWLQKAFGLIDVVESEVLAGVAEIKRSCLRNLARAYLLSSTYNPAHLSRAETALQELVSGHTDAEDLGSAENQELRWWLLAVLQRREAADDILSYSFRSIVDTMVFSEGNVARIIQEVKALDRPRHQLVTSVLSHCIERYAVLRDVPETILDQVLLALIFHCSKAQDHTAAMTDLHQSFDQIVKQDLALSKTGATACLMLFWQHANQHHRAKRLSEAVDWYLIGTHSAFQTIADVSSDKCYRKAALCLLELHDFSRATMTAQRCNLGSALTQYVLLVAAVRQGSEEEAKRAVTNMVKASDYEGSMLLMAIRLAHESDLKVLLLSVLEEMLRSLKQAESLRAEPEAVALIRCTIRLVLRLMAEPISTDRNKHVAALIGHFETAQQLVQTARDEKRAALIIKDISWLWRTAYNCANQGCAEWDDAERKVPALFDIAGQLIETYREVVVQVDEEVYMAMVFSSFAATSARVFAIRHRAQLPGYAFHNEAGSIAELSQCTRACEQVIRAVLQDTPLGEANAAVVLRCLRAVLVFEAEVAILAKKWDIVPEILEAISGLPNDLVNTLEAVVDLLWAARDCPLTVLVPALESILHASLDHQALSVHKFARWLRAICTMLLSKNTTPDRLRTITYIEQGVSVLGEHSQERDDRGEVYPLDERHWLVTTSYNTGLECLHVGLVDEAKRWFEVSTIICRFLPDGETVSTKISDTYTILLGRYSP
ncbi:unnamed protein product [Peniophora sp. CBMAI 1063]|nr:unnamed protein product [Peniophora sp. CBMAI 1063]